MDCCQAKEIDILKKRVQDVEKRRMIQELKEQNSNLDPFIGLLLAQRMQEEEEMTEQQKKRQAEVLESAKYYIEEDWDIIRANVESNAELSKILLGENKPGEDFATRMKLSDEEIKAKYKRLVRSIVNFVPMGAEVKEVPVTEEPVKEPTALKQEEIEQPIKKSGRQKSMARKRNWKLHKSSGVHTLKTDTEMVIHMLVEKKYHLMKKVLLQMLELKLESEDDSTMALELIKFIKQ
ncbi:hypothetical protein Tco_0940061 [Tanacetum coccineum]|uniref:Uncharacterized protein n=1 Tax=Tanacetum coccineum TaxID=301880 RepID=A0ABQ5DLW2_9ASTR